MKHTVAWKFYNFEDLSLSIGREGSLKMWANASSVKFQCNNVAGPTVKALEIFSNRDVAATNNLTVTGQPLFSGRGRVGNTLSVDQLVFEPNNFKSVKWVYSLTNAGQTYQLQYYGPNVSFSVITAHDSGNVDLMRDVKVGNKLLLINI